MKKIYSVRKGPGDKIQYALGDIRKVKKAKWMKEKRRLRHAVNQSIKAGHISVGHASDLYIGKKVKDQRK